MMTPSEDDERHMRDLWHTAYLLIDTWDRHVADSGCADDFPDVKAAAERAREAMVELYHIVENKLYPIQAAVGDRPGDATDAPLS